MFIDFILLIPELFLIYVICLLFFYSMAYASSEKLNYPLMNENTLVLISMSFFLLFILSINQHITDISLLNGLFYKTEFTILLESVLILLGLLYFLLTFTYTYTHFNSYEILLVLLISFLGMIALLHSNHLFSMYLALELQSICFYLLVSMRPQNLNSIESSLKYFILGSFSSAILLFGISYIYGFTGLVYFEDLSKFLLVYDDINIISYFCLGMILLFVGLFFKIYAAPFHFWISDIYAGSTYNITMFFSIFPFVSFFSIFVKFKYFVFFDYIHILNNLLIIISVLSMLFGSLGALYQSEIKRIMAYSSIAHTGYFLTFLTSNSIYTLIFVVNYIFIYAFTLLIIFGIIINLAKYTRDFSQKDRYSYADNISEFYLFSKYANGVYAFLFSMSLFSLIGIPPFSGFFAKLYLITTLIESKSYLLVFVLIVSSLVSAYYLLRLVKVIYFYHITPNRFISIKGYRFFEFIAPKLYISILIIVYIALLTLLYVIFPDFIIDLIYNSVLGMFI